MYLSFYCLFGFMTTQHNHKTTLPLTFGWLPVAMEYFYLFLLDAGAGIFLSWPPAAPLDEIQGSPHLRLTICFQSIEVTLTDIHSNVSLQLVTLTACDSLLICT